MRSDLNRLMAQVLSSESPLYVSIFSRLTHATPNSAFQYQSHLNALRQSWRLILYIYPDVVKHFYYTIREWSFPDSSYILLDLTDLAGTKDDSIFRPKPRMVSEPA